MDETGQPQADEKARVLRPGVLHGSRLRCHPLHQRSNIRRTTKEVLKDLPPKITSVIPFRVQGYSEYQHAEENFAEWLAEKSPEKKDKALKAEAIVKMGYLKRLAANLKMPQVLKWVDDFLEESEGKIIIFAIHKNVIARIKERYKRISVKLDGETSMADRKTAVTQFQNDRKIRSFIGNIKAAGTGINLTAANTVLFSEIDWVPGNHTQAAKRAHRIGTVSKVRVIYTVARDTIEEDLLKIIQTKQKSINKALDGNGSAMEMNVYDQLMEQIMRTARLPPQMIAKRAARYPLETKG